MKSIKKTGTFLCLIAIILAAAGPGTKVHASEAETGSLTIHKYALPEGVSAGDPGTGLVENPPEGSQALPGISFEVVRVANDTTDAANAVIFEGPGSYADSLETNEQGIAVFSPLPRGVYKVTELPNPLVAEPIDPFLVRIPTTNPAGTGLIYNVHVYPKNWIAAEDLAIDKTIDDLEKKSKSVSIGETITWYIAVTVPAHIGTAQQFSIVDHFGSLMEYDDTELSVVLINSENTRSTLESPASYTTSASETSLTITFTEAGIALLDDAGAGEGNASLEISVTTALNGGAENFLGEQIKNGAQAVYRNAAGKLYTPRVTDEPYVITGGVIINKTNTEELPLAGAVFRIYDDPNNAAAGNDETVPPPGGGDVWSVTTNTSGEAVFAGLKNGDYWIVETQAPKKDENTYYNLLEAPVPVPVTSSIPLPTVDVVNQEDGPGFVLPVTGGLGSWLLTLAGVVLAGVGIFVFFILRRKDSEESDEK